MEAKTLPDRERRRVHILDTTSWKWIPGHWMGELRFGMVFRLFEPDGTEVMPADELQSARYRLAPNQLPCYLCVATPEWSDPEARILKVNTVPICLQEEVKCSNCGRFKGWDLVCAMAGHSAGPVEIIARQKVEASPDRPCVQAGGDQWKRKE